MFLCADIYPVVYPLVFSNIFPNVLPCTLSFLSSHSFLSDPPIASYLGAPSQFQPSEVSLLTQSAR